MSYEQSRSEVQRSHTLSMENRDKLSLTGVEDVSGFDESIVQMQTELGALTVHGSNLRVETLSVDSGDLLVVGDWEGMFFSLFSWSNLLTGFSLSQKENKETWKSIGNAFLWPFCLVRRGLAEGRKPCFSGDGGL